MTKQTRGIDSDDYLSEGNGSETSINYGANFNNNNNEDEVYPSSPRPKSPEIVSAHSLFYVSRSLPWKPKVR